MQAQNAYAQVQGQIHGAWWDIAKVIGTDVKNATDEAGLQQALDNYSAAISAVFSMTEEEKNAWGVVGSFLDSNWGDKDYPMTEVEAGVFQSEVLELKAGDELKCRQGASWDVNFPAENVKVEADGSYIVQLTYDGENGEVILIAQ